MAQYSGWGFFQGEWGVVETTVGIAKSRFNRHHISIKKSYQHKFANHVWKINGERSEWQPSTEE